MRIDAMQWKPSSFAKRLKNFSINWHQIRRLRCAVCIVFMLPEEHARALNMHKIAKARDASAQQMTCADMYARHFMQKWQHGISAEDANMLTVSP